MRKEKVKVLAAQSYLTLCDPMACSPPASSVEGILEWVASLFSRGSFQTRDQTQVSCIAGRYFNLNGNLPQCSCLENPRDGGAGWAAIYGVAQSQTWLKRLSSSSISSRKIGIFFCNHLSQKKQLLNIQFSSVQSLSHVRLFATPWIAARQASLSITNSRSSLRLTSIKSVIAIQPSHPLSFPSPPAPNPSQHQGLFQWVNSSHELAKVLEFQLQHHSLTRNPRVDLLQNGLVGSPCSPRDSQESSPTPQFKSINSLELSFLHSPILTSIHDHWKNHSLD